MWRLFWKSLKELGKARPPKPPRGGIPPYGLEHYVAPEDRKDYHSTLILPIVILVPMAAMLPPPSHQPQQELPMWASRQAIETSYHQLEAK